MSREPDHLFRCLNLVPVRRMMLFVPVEVQYLIEQIFRTCQLLRVLLNVFIRE